MPRAGSAWCSGWRAVLTASCAVALIAALFLWRQLERMPPEPPTVQLAGLDAAIARAIFSARTDVQNAPRSGAAWGKFGMVLLAHDFRSAAMRCFEEADRLDPREPRWPYFQGIVLSSGQPDAGISKLERAIERWKPAPCAARLRLAELLLAQGRVDAAAEEYRRVAEQEPSNTAAMLGRARIALANRQFQEARAHARRAADSAPTAKGARLLLAQIAEKLGEKPVAAAELRAARTLPEDAPPPDPIAEEVAQLATGRQARLSRADGLIAAGRPAEAARLLRQITEDYPNSDWAWMLLGRALLMNGNISGAERALHTAARLSPESVGTHYHLGIAALARKDHVAVARHLEKATQLQPDFAPAHCNLARSLLAQGDRSGAEARFRAALRAQPNYAEAHTALAELLAPAGREAEAAEHRRHALELKPAGIPQGAGPTRP